MMGFQELQLRPNDRSILFFQDMAPSLAQTHGIAYPARLEAVMRERLEKLTLE